MIQKNSNVTPLKGNDETFENKMRYAGALAAEVLTVIEPFVAQGITTERLDQLCHDFIVTKQKAIPACLGYRGFPKSVCISINDVVCHGIPSKKILKSGDIVNIDVTVLAHGVYGDTSKMFFIGEVKPWIRRLCEITQQALYEAIQLVRPGLRLNRIGASIERLAKKENYSIVKEFSGHFIGTKFHEQPDVLHYYACDGGFILKPGMTFTIEPMLNLGQRYIKIMSDQWTVRTKDRKASAQYEHTILVTDTGYEILTLRSDESIARLN